MDVPAAQHSRPDLSICVTVKNRSRVIAEGHELKLFPNCIRSVVASIPANLDCELVVADWQSDDWPLDQWIGEAVGCLPLKLLTLTGDFSRGQGRNAAAEAAGSDWLFFLDADCVISERVLQRGTEVLANEKAFFPVVYAYNDPEHESGHWCHGGYGNCMVSRNVFARVGHFPEYPFWGREDVHFFEKVAAIQDVIRGEMGEFDHQWHPDDFAWKNRYGTRSAYEERRIAENKERLAATVDDIMQILSATESLILVDYRELEGQLPSSLRTSSFLDMDGVYRGLPADSLRAIADLEHLRCRGATFIAFLWTAFWWFDYYTELRDYLSSRYERVVSNDRLVLFDLRR
jgi:hypothetical protein